MKLLWSEEDKNDSSYDRFIYEKECSCGKIIRLKTQHDDCPEYHTTIKIICDGCKSEVEFLLPVN